MNAELEAIKAAHDAAVEQVDVGANPDDFLNPDAHTTVRDMANAYVAAHPEQFTPEALALDPDDVPGLVAAVDVFRDRGLLEWQWRVEVWILHHVPPQNIGGEYRAPLNPAPNAVTS